MSGAWRVVRGEKGHLNRSPHSPRTTRHSHRTRDVTVACLLAMQDVRVRFPLGALAQDVGKPGNPPVSGTGKRGFKSHRPDFLRCGPMVRRLPVKETIAGSIPAAAA